MTSAGGSGGGGCGGAVRGVVRRVLPETIRRIPSSDIVVSRRLGAGAFGEIGSWDEITALERRVFRAVGKAHLATNLSVFTHTGIPGKSALEQLDILEDAGVDPRRVAIGHLGNLNDPNLYVHKAICRRGAFVALSDQGRTWLAKRQVRAA